MSQADRSSAMSDVDLTDLDLFADGFPHATFVRHRAEAPVYWHEPTEHTPDGEGFWSVATHAEVGEVLHDPDTYSSETGGDRPYGGTLIQDLPVSGQVLNMMDDPRHARIRRLVSSGLTPRMVRSLESELRVRTRSLLSELEPGVEFDFLRDIAAELPMQMICILLGVPQDERHWLFEAVEPGFDYRGKRKSFEVDSTTDDIRARMLQFGRDLIASKRVQPGDDMLSIVVHATFDDVEPNRLTDDELYMFFSLLFAAGSETTRNAIAGGLWALLEHPDQLAILTGDPDRPEALLASTVEEMLRWTTPSPSKRRTATRETTLHGCAIAAGEKVVVWEGSANRDELAFADAMTFDITRSANPHFAFGHGIHHCLGASLARLEMSVIFSELFTLLDERDLGIEPAGSIEWTRSNRHTGVRQLPLRIT
jgi:cytochrome P450